MPAANETRTRRPFGGVRPSEGRCVSAIRRRSGRRTTGIVCPPSLARIDFCPLENQGVSDEKVSGTFSRVQHGEEAEGGAEMGGIGRDGA